MACNGAPAARMRHVAGRPPPEVRVSVFRWKTGEICKKPAENIAKTAIPAQFPAGALTGPLGDKNSCRVACAEVTGKYNSGTPAASLDPLGAPVHFLGQMGPALQKKFPAVSWPQFV